MTENRESATGKIRQSKGAATFFFIYFYFSLVYFYFFALGGLIFPSGWAGCATYTNQRIAHGLWSLYTGGVGIGTRDFRLTMACSGHSTILYSAFPSAAFFMPDV
jgi:hypothetical protein